MPGLSAGAGTGAWPPWAGAGGGVRCVLASAPARRAASGAVQIIEKDTYPDSTNRYRNLTYRNIAYGI